METTQLPTAPGPGAPGVAGAARSPGAATLPALMANTLSALVDSAAGVDRMMASLAAARAQAITDAARWSEVTEGAVAPAAPSVPGWSPEELARRTVVAELACALRMPERTVERLLQESLALVTDLPDTLDALGHGDVSYPHAQAIIDHAMSLPAEARAAFEAAVLPYALTHTAAQTKARARVTREVLHPDSIEARRVAREAERCVTLEPAEDGMAWLNLFIPAHRAVAIHRRVTDVARSLQGPDEQRTLTQLRADVACDILIDGETPEGIGHGVRATVHVTVPALTLLDRGNEPATLDGYGPIDAETAKELTAGAPSMTRILTHPETGAVLSVGRDRYRIPKDLRVWLSVRDRTCRFPGCATAARYCDVDHSDDWQFGGPSDHDNLAHLCPKHHTLKHKAGWTVRHTGAGALEWTSPHGASYATEAAIAMRPAVPGGSSSTGDPPGSRLEP